ncbi:MAG: YbhB/YbcL family Raf kinase inhibitor-like protein [Planctomycetota bacterium]|nr:YbhB/YbcL family Raf kinase inhibitor-like protein [Planctomycetota bacterium]
MGTKPGKAVRRAARMLALAAALAVATCDRPPPTEATMKLTSPAFANGARIPVRHTGEGDDRSPPLEWTDPPEGTKSFALICDDPDAPRGTWDHWLVWNLPATLRQLPEGVPTTKTLPDLGGAMQGNNSWPKIGYGGPMPPPGHGTHHYHFVLYALDAPLDLAPGANKAALQKAMKGRVLAEARLMGTYSR